MFVLTLPFTLPLRDIRDENPVSDEVPLGDDRVHVVHARQGLSTCVCKVFEDVPVKEGRRQKEVTV